MITTIAGTDFIFPPTPIRGPDAPLGKLSSTSVDESGNVYVVDRDSCVALRIAPDGVTTAIAGNGLCLFSGTVLGVAPGDTSLVEAFRKAEEEAHQAAGKKAPVRESLDPAVHHRAR